MVVEASAYIGVDVKEVESHPKEDGFQNMANVVLQLGKECWCWLIFHDVTFRLFFLPFLAFL